MNELRIYFLDLIAFVPAADGSYWILLPEAQQPTVASDGTTAIDPHFPIALFDLGDQGASDWQRIHHLLKLAQPPGDHEAWLLERQELRIAVPQALPVQAAVGAATGLPTVATRADFSWVPNLPSVGIPATVDSACYKDAGQAPSPKIVARLPLRVGSLQSFRFVKRVKNPHLPLAKSIPRLELRPLGGGGPVGSSRACADFVMARIPFSTPTIEISTVSLDSGQPIPGRSIVLTPTGPENQKVAELLVANLSPDPLGEGPPYGVHFERYYDLFQTPAPNRPIPYVDAGFPQDASTYTSPQGIDGDLPTFITAAIRYPFGGLNGAICSLVTLG